MRVSTSSTEWIIRLHTILIGASPLIPVPFLDELVAFYLRRHLVSEIAKRHNQILSRDEVNQLANEVGGGCLSALSFIIILPVKELFREIFFWLEWKRGVDLATQTYYFGYLLNDIFGRADFRSRNTGIYRQAIHESLLGFQTERLRDVVKQAFFSSKTVVREVRHWLFQFAKYYLKLILALPVRLGRQLVSRFRGRRIGEAVEPVEYAQKLDDFFEQSRPQLSNLSADLSKSLEGGIEKLPAHFEQLSKRLDDRLAFYSKAENYSRLLSRRETHSVTGMASFWAGLLALSTVFVIVAGFYSQRYRDIPAVGLVVAWLPCASAFLILMGAGLGFASLLEKERRNLFGILGLLVSALTALACCVLFGVIFVSTAGLGS